MGEVPFHRRDAPISSLGFRGERTSRFVVAMRSEPRYSVDAGLAEIRRRSDVLVTECLSRMHFMDPR